jgi:hypothetical protein
MTGRNIMWDAPCLAAFARRGNSSRFLPSLFSVEERRFSAA